MTIYTRLRVPVWASDRAVIKAARRRLSPFSRSKGHRALRHEFYRRVLAEHHQAQDVYHYVTHDVPITGDEI